MSVQKLKPMTPEDIEAAIQQYVQDATTYLQSELSPTRATATKYYNGEKFGNEEKGRSSFVSTDVRDGVLAVLPSLMRMFFPTSGHVIEYRARPKTMQLVDQAVKGAKQATEVVNEVVLDQDNDGYSEGLAAFKDALVRKLGTLKWWWDDTSSYKTYTADNCDVVQYEQLLSDPDVEITKETQHTDEQNLPRWDVEYKHWRREGVAKIRCVPPEEMLISRDARSLEDATYIGHQTEKTTSELLAMGVPLEDIQNFGGPSTEVRQSIEEITRRGGIAMTDQATEPALIKNLWIESYCYLPLNGKDAQLCRVRTIGPGYHVVGEPEPIDSRPFAMFCPDPEPHVLIGNSFADRLMDLQLMNSSIVRAAADTLADSIDPREYYMEGTIDRQAMESTAIGQKIPVRDGIQPSQAVQVVSKEWHGQDALNFLGYLNQVKQNRTGPLPATLDPDAMQSTPEVGVKATVQAASEQLELIARNFTVGMKQLGKGLLKLLVENQPKKRIVRLRGEYVEIDPRAWDAEMDVSVNVAIGTQEKLGVLAATAAAQKEILMTLGPTNPLVTIGQLRHTYATMLELQGIPDTGNFFKEIDPKWQPPPPPQTPDPNMVLAQAEMIKAQGQLAKDKADFQVEQAKAVQKGQEGMTDGQLRAAELQLKREEMHLTDERERDKAEADVAVKIAVANAQFQSQITMEQIRASIEQEKMGVQREQMATDAALAAHQGNGNGGSEKPKAEEAPKPKPKPKTKVTKVIHDKDNRISELRSTETD